MKQIKWAALLAVTLVFGCAKSNDYSNLVLTKDAERNLHQGTRPTLGIAFGGGGIRGYMHLGVIKALMEHHIQADLVTGSSAGSIAATFYASGMSYPQLESVMSDLNTLSLLDVVWSKKGLINGQNLAQWVNDSVAQTDLSEMPTPIGITATDMTAKSSVLIQQGNPGEAVQTSSSIPGAFVPVLHAGHVLVDGGVLHIVPVDYAKSMGADIVIAVDIYCANQPEVKDSAMQMQLAVFRLLTCRLSEDEIQRAQLVVRPNYEPEGSGLFSDKSIAIEAGYQAMMAKMPQLKRLLAQSR